MNRPAVVTIAALDLRRRPDHRSELRSQLLLGELVTVVARGRNGQWYRVENSADGYRGWVRSWGLQPLTAQEAAEWKRAALWRVHANYVELRSSPEGGRKLGPLFWNSRVAGARVDGGFRVILPDGTQAWTEPGNLRRAGGPAGTLDQLIRRFWGAPYLWGGRTPLGFDCSGFVQQVMAGQGIALPRDAHDQYLACRPSTLSTAPRRGDLVFFGKRGSRMEHVGIALGKGLFAHARGTVRMNSLQASNDLYDKPLALMLRAVGRPRTKPRGGHSC